MLWQQHSVGRKKVYKEKNFTWIFACDAKWTVREPGSLFGLSLTAHPSFPMCLRLVDSCILPSFYSLLWCRHSRWSRREEADFYRTVSTFGVEFDRETGHFKWDRFRAFARLDRKYDETLTEYFHAFYYMCQSVCGKFRAEDRGNATVM